MASGEALTRRVRYSQKTTAGHRLGVGLLITLAFLSLYALFQVDPESPLPLHGWTIALDPGHGGTDRGACHFGDGLIEKQINLDVTFRLRERLNDLGATTILTRTDDTFIPLDVRAEIANRASADLFISLHVNRYPSAVCFGAQTFYFPGSEPSRRLAELIQDELLDIDPDNYRQALSGNYRVLRQTTMPAALVEIGFITHPGDRGRLRDFAYRDEVAARVAEGIKRFVHGAYPATE